MFSIMYNRWWLNFAIDFIYVLQPPVTALLCPNLGRYSMEELCVVIVLNLMYFADLLDDRFSTYRDVDTFFIWVAQQNTSIWFISYTPFTNGVEWKIPPPINQGYPPALPTLLYKLRPWLLSKLLACCQVRYFARPNSFLTWVRKEQKFT